MLHFVQHDNMDNHGSVGRLEDDGLEVDGLPLAADGLDAQLAGALLAHLDGAELDGFESVVVSGIGGFSGPFLVGDGHP